MKKLILFICCAYIATMVGRVQDYYINYDNYKADAVNVAHAYEINTQVAVLEHKLSALPVRAMRGK